MVSASSRSVQMSVIRSSSVGMLGRRSDVPPDLGRVLAPGRSPPAPRPAAASRASSPEALGRCRSAAGRRRPRGRIGLEAGLLPAPERRAGRQRQEVGQEVADLVHQVDPQVLVLDLGVDVHAADHLPPRQHLEVVGQRTGSAPFRCCVVGPDARWDASRRPRSPCRARGRSRPTVRAQPDQLAPVPPLSSGQTRLPTSTCALQQLLGDLLAEPLACRRRMKAGSCASDRARRWPGRPAVFLLDADRQRRCGRCHGDPLWATRALAPAD